MIPGCHMQHQGMDNLAQTGGGGLDISRTARLDRLNIQVICNQVPIPAQPEEWRGLDFSSNNTLL